MKRVGRGNAFNRERADIIIIGNDRAIKKAYAERYTSDVVRYVEGIDDNGFLSAHIMSGKDSMRITVCGNEDRILLVSVYDNLGKGASGAAVECMNMVLGAERTEGLVL